MNISRVQEIVEENDVVVFGKGEKGHSNCEMTTQLQDMFEEIFPDYEMIDVEDDPEMCREIRSASGCSIFPQVFIHGEFSGDFDTICEMEEDGELYDLIGQD